MTTLRNLIFGILTVISFSVFAQKVDTVTFKKGQQELDNSNFKEAIQLFSKVIAKSDFAPAYSERAAARWYLNDLKGAVEDYTIAISLCPDSELYIHNRGLANQQLNNYEAAISDFKTAIKLKPNNPGAYNDLGVVYDIVGNSEEAENAYTEGIKINSHFAKLYYNRGIVKANREDYQGLIDDCTEAIKLDSLYTGAYYNRAKAYWNFKKYEEAITDFDKVISIDPDYESGRAYYCRGMVKWSISNSFKDNVYETDVTTTQEACSDFKIACKKGIIEACNVLKTVSFCN